MALCRKLKAVMKNLKVILAIALVFAAGFAAGVVTTRTVVRQVVNQAVSNPDRLRALIERRLTTRLRLDAEQKRKTDQILTRTQEDIKALRREFAPRFILIVSNAESEIDATLTSD